MSNYQLDYTLSSKELYSALAAARIVPKRGLSQIIRTVLLLVVMVIVGINMSVDINYVKIGVVLEAICIVLLVLIWILPTLAFKSAIKTVGNKIDIRAEVQPGVITFDDGTTVKMGENGSIEDYPKERMFMVSSFENKDQVYIIPYRAVDFEQFEDFRKTIMSDPVNENNVPEKSEQSEQEQEDDESFRLSQQIEAIINNTQTSDASEPEESIADEATESIVSELEENIADEDESVDDQQPAEQSEQQPDQIDEQPADDQTANQDETAEAEQEQDEDDQFKIDFSQIILQNVDYGAEEVFEVEAAEDEAVEEETTDDIVTEPEIVEVEAAEVEAAEIEVTEQEETVEVEADQSEQTVEVEETIEIEAAQSEQATEDEAAENIVIEDKSSEAVDNTDENQAVGVEAVEDKTAEDKSADSHSIEKDDSQAIDNNYEGIVLSDFDVQISDDGNIAPKIHHDDIFDDSLRNLIDAYLN